MKAFNRILGTVIAFGAVGTACVLDASRASADDARLKVVPAVRTSSGDPGTKVQLAQWGRPYGYRYGGYYRPYYVVAYYAPYARPYYAPYYAYPSYGGYGVTYGYGYPAYGYGYGYPAYGGIGIRAGGVGVGIW